MGITPKDDFLELKPAIDTMAEEDTVSINMPFKHYLQECQLVYQLLMKYRAHLEENNMDFIEIQKIPQLISASREILSQFSMISFPTPASRMAWEKGREEGEALIYDLKAAMDYSFQNHPELLSQVSVIRQGASNADFIQDLSDAHVLCRENRDLLDAIHYDFANVERAAVLTNELSGLLAQATLDKSDTPELRIDRDKCFTLLKKSVDAAIRQARFIYRNEKKTASQFMIRPPRRNGSKTKKEPVEETVETV